MREMAAIRGALGQNRLTIYAALAFALAVLLALSPAEATLGNVVKIVYAHGAAERVATYAYILAAGLGLAHLSLKREFLARWAQSAAEAAILFWLVQFIISLPAQVMAWGAITLNEPRVAGAVWILGLTLLVYGVACWIGESSWMSMAAVANAVILLVVLRGAVNILHPFDPILGSDSPAIKTFYAAIVIAMGLVAFQLARDRVQTLTSAAKRSGQGLR